MNRGVRETIREALERDEVTGVQHLEFLVQLVAGYASDPNVTNPVKYGIDAYDGILDEVMK